MKDKNCSGGISLVRILTKGMVLFILVTLCFGLLDPLPVLGKISAYNHLFPGRHRLPYGENPEQAYNLSLYNLEAMFASHKLDAGKKRADEIRIVLIGDSSVWGYMLKPEETLAAQIDAAGLIVDNQKIVHVYNLGYPTLSLTKDLLLLSRAVQYEPDLIVWLFTLESFPVSKQLDSPIVQNNASAVKHLINQYSLRLDIADPKFVVSNFWSSTLIGQRRALADMLRLQIYGVMWAATGIDQAYPASFEPPQEDLEADETFQGLQPPQLRSEDLSFDVLIAGSEIVGDIPILYVNEPIYLSQGDNSDIRYNFFYPRWAYDQYREMFSEFCWQHERNCLDTWNLVSPSLFTNSAIHMDPQGTQLLAEEIGKSILSVITP